ncbi:LCP family protein [Quadrisphaera oryzae]|uniref:LCP family protein n=1 Tax=Quadrisphaera TaxID=317661 RepID=UPI0016484510|nr:LCP family protein [Quadrisphaera sp. RL12-1S]MBC3761739.1 LCP family protein [Quadrisphaera sp. RL12-1S]
MNGVLGPRQDLEDLFEPRPPKPAPPGQTTSRVMVMIMAVVLVVTGAVTAVQLARSTSAIQHLGDPFAPIPAAERPTVAPAAAQALNVLVIGSDSRDSQGDTDDWTRGGQRSDVLAVLHLSADRTNAQVVSIPRDSWVPVPGYGTTKVNAAYSYGGVPLAVHTVEQLTGLRIDHVVAIDFTGFARITDALGGVDICVPETTTDGIGTVPAGCSTMTGDQALSYVRQRKTLPGGDFDRMHRQQNWMRAVLQGVADKGLLQDPARTASVVSTVAAWVRTDDGLSDTQLLSLAWDLRTLGREDVTFLTAPLADPATGMEGSASVVYLDQTAGAQLWAYLKDDDAAAWLAQNPDAALGNTSRPLG